MREPFCHRTEINMFIIYRHIERDAEILSVANELREHDCISVIVNASYIISLWPYSEMILLGTK